MSRAWARFPVAVHVLCVRRDEILLLRRDTIPYVRAGIGAFGEGRWFQEFGWG